MNEHIRRAMRVVANLSTMFKNIPLLERYSMASKFGFKLIELPFGYTESAESLKAAADAYNLHHVLINAKNDEKLGGLAARNGMEKEFRSLFDTTLNYAQTVHVMSGDGDPTKDEETYKNNLHYACQRLAEKNILCVIEPLNGHNFPNYFLRSYDQAERIINDLKEPNLKILFDVYHAQLICGQLTYTLSRLASLIGHVQVSQPPDRHEPDTDGEVNFGYFFKLLEKTNPQWLIGAEYFDSNPNAEWVQKFGLSF